MTEESLLEDKTVGPRTYGEAVGAHFVSVLTYGIGYGLAVAKSPDDDITNGKTTIVETVLIISFAIQILAFIPAFAFQTEKFYDLTGSITYLTCTWYSFYAGGRISSDFQLGTRSIIVSILVTIWGLRLGSFLFRRVLRDSKDGRFDELKPSFALFFMTWMLQGLWVFLTAYAVYIINAESTTESNTLAVTDYVGLCIWISGFTIEVVSDHQKSYWRTLPENKGQFINYGLWYYSRHPNYFGEMVLWWGVFVMSLEVLEGTQYCAVISPIFVFCLIYFVSGVRMLEKRSDEKFADNDAYWEYKRNTHVLIPLPKGWGGKKNASPPTGDTGSAEASL